MVLLVTVLLFLHLILECEASNCSSASLRVSCDGGDPSNLYCSSKMSRYCDENRATVPKYCYDTLGEIKDIEVCTLDAGLGVEDCGGVEVGHVTPPEEALAELRLYHHDSPNNHWGPTALLNLTLPHPTWKELKVHYTYLSSTYLSSRDRCRNFTLRKPVNTSLMYDCRIRQKSGDKPMSVKLSVLSDSGRGASYLYYVPSGQRVNPRETCPSDWHVFFYVQLDGLEHRQPLPVIIQAAPYANVSYRVALVQCLHYTQEEECQDSTELNHVSVSHNTSDEVRVVRLEPVTTPGRYFVTVQMEADWCPQPSGCYLSVSPRFEVPATYIWHLAFISILLVLSIVASVLALFCQRWRANKDLLLRQQPTVLLVYHPESRAALHLITTLATFLQNTCHLTCLMADGDNGVGNEHPSTWIKTHLSQASRVLFVVPQDPNAPSYTPFTRQWSTALEHRDGHDFKASQRGSDRLAKLMLPASGAVPCQIQDLRRIEVRRGPAVLAAWLHGGSFLDQVFFWWPHIRSVSRNSMTPTWQDVQQAAQAMLTNSPDTSTTQAEALRLPPRPAVGPGRSDGHSSDGESDGVKSESTVDLAFCSEIPSMNQVSGVSEGDVSTPDNSSDESVDGVFQ